MDQSLIDKLRAEHEDCKLIKTNGLEIVVKRPNRGEYKRFMKSVSSERDKADAIETLVLDCVVHPTRKEFDALLNKLPALCEELGEHVLELAGLSGKAQAEKL
jgi:hypothetical protein